MKKYTFIPLIWAVLLIAISACSDSQLKKQDSSGEEEEIKATLNAMWAAIENEDVDLYASFIHPDFTQFGETDQRLSIGKEAEVEGTREWIKNSKNIHTEMEEPIVVVKDSVAWIIYYWKDQGTTRGEAFASRGKSTRIFVKEKGKWLCIHGHYTLLPES